METTLKLTWVKRYIDVAISFQTMHHFSHAEKIGLYAKVHKALKPEGIYIECDYMVTEQAVEDETFRRRHMMIFVCYPKCTTCQKAKNWLSANGIVFEERNIKENNPTLEELKEWHKKSGLPLKKFFNTSGLQYKELKLKDKLPTLSEDEQFKLLASDGMIVKRPILIGDGFVLVGFSEAGWKTALSVE